jgi:hypothetical protein
VIHGAVCAWCDGPVPSRARSDSRYCGKACRQTAFRLRHLYTRPVAGEVLPRRFAYADPPYPGLARRYYGREATYAGEVDHAALIASLMDGGFMGWALSTGAYALREVLPLCPPEVRVCSWAKMNGAVPATKGLHNGWEPLIVWGGRQAAPGKRDYLCAKPARGGGTLVGRKPLAFCAWLFECLGMCPGDELADLFPGTGVVGRSWRELSPGAGGADVVRDASRLEERRLQGRRVAGGRQASPVDVDERRVASSSRQASLFPGELSRRTSA